MILTRYKVRAHSCAHLYLLLTLIVSFLPFRLLAASSDYPVYVTQVPNPNDYTVFANAGWDGNWYVGYNNGWVKKLPPVPQGSYARAYLGAKLGRMKTLPPVGRPPEFNPLPGEIWIALASTTAWKPSQSLQLTTTDDIPFEGSPQYPLENVGESEWFWKEIPLSWINGSGDNFVALWSPTPEFVAVSSAPVLAAALGGKELNTWVANRIKGKPPDAASAMATAVSFFQPAIALKLIPVGNPHPMAVRIVSWQNGTPDHLKPVVIASVVGESIERVWIERSNPVHSGDVVRGRFTQVGRSLWKAPYAFSLDQTKLPSGKLQLRAAAVNIWGETAYSEPFKIDVSPIPPKK